MYGFKNSIMKKRELFDKILAIVEEETEISREEILSKSKKEEVVDARALLVFVLHSLGFYPIQISLLSGICQRCINPYIANFKDRKDDRRILRLNYENVTKKLREIEEQTP